MNFEEIGELIHGKRPPWLPGSLDHLRAIPGTKSYVFYPYTFSASEEEELSRLCSGRLYAVVRRPKEESEYNPDAHKVLILEPNPDEEKVECGCGLIAKWYRISHARGKAGTLGTS